MSVTEVTTVSVTSAIQSQYSVLIISQKGVAWIPPLDPSERNLNASIPKHVKAMVPFWNWTDVSRSLGALSWIIKPTSKHIQHWQRF
jgi:hypothetical protein